MRRLAHGMLLALAIPAGVVSAEESFIYPAKGQSAEQLKKDKGECHVWAVEQTGFDPATAQAPAKTVAQPQEKVVGSGAIGRSAVRGAVVGTAAGAIAGDAGKGAAIGAATGGLVGGMRRADQVRNPKSVANPEYAAYEQKRTNYLKASKACLTARGYTVE